jgi:hypothetical protein
MPGFTLMLAMLPVFIVGESAGICIAWCAG